MPVIGVGEAGRDEPVGPRARHPRAGDDADRTAARAQEHLLGEALDDGSSKCPEEQLTLNISGSSSPFVIGGCRRCSATDRPSRRCSHGRSCRRRRCPPRPSWQGRDALAEQDQEAHRRFAVGLAAGMDEVVDRRRGRPDLAAARARLETESVVPALTTDALNTFSMWRLVLVMSLVAPVSSGAAAICRMRDRCGTRGPFRRRRRRG